MDQYAVKSQNAAVSARDSGIFDAEIIPVTLPNGGHFERDEGPHPYGMTGARSLCTMLNELQAANKSIGLETMCVGGGQGMAMIVERLS